MERVAFRPVRGASGTTLLLTSFAVSAILRVLFQNLISARPIPVSIPTSLSGVVTIGPLHLGMIQLISIVVTLVMLLGLNLFLHRTMAGRAMRAAAEDFAVLRLMGIRANSVVATAFAISGLLAGVAGLLWVAQRGSVDPLMGALPVLKAFIAAIIGGLGSLSGAVAGGFLLGFIEVILQAYLPESLLPYRDAFAILLVIAVLLFRPQGLLARKTLVKLLTEPPRVYRRAKLSENCPLWNRHQRRRPRSRIHLSSANERCGWRWNTAMSIKAKLRR